MNPTLRFLAALLASWAIVIPLTMVFVWAVGL